jgi:hypothetical protein
MRGKVSLIASFFFVIFATGSARSALAGCGSVWGTLVVGVSGCSLDASANTQCLYGELPGYAYIQQVHRAQNGWGAYAWWYDEFNFGYGITTSGSTTGWPREGFTVDANHYIEDVDSGEVYLDGFQGYLVYLEQCV